MSYNFPWNELERIIQIIQFFVANDHIYKGRLHALFWKIAASLWRIQLVIYHWSIFVYNYHTKYERISVDILCFDDNSMRIFSLHFKYEIGENQPAFLCCEDEVRSGWIIIRFFTWSLLIANTYGCSIDHYRPSCINRVYSCWCFLLKGD